MKKFIKDFLDNGAEVKNEKIDYLKIPSLILVSLTTFFGINDYTVKVFQEFLGISNTFIKIVLIVATLVFTMFLITSKLHSTDKGKTYNYNQVIRNLAKIYFVIILVIFFMTLTNFFFDKEHLDESILKGYVYCEHEMPLSNKRVEIVDYSGKVISLENTYYTDSNGFFYIECNKKIPINSIIRFYITFPSNFLSVELENYFSNQKKIKKNEVLFKFDKC